MKKYFAQLRPLERRLVVGVAVVVLVVLNWVFIWPHFDDLSNYKRRLSNAEATLKTYQATIAQTSTFKEQLKKYESEGDIVPPGEQSINLMQNLQAQAAACGFNIQNFSHSMMSTNQFFVEQVQNITVVAPEDQLVDFLYKLGSGTSMIRVRDLSLQPDQQHQRLAADIQLVASFQKNPTATAANTVTAKAK